MSPDSRRALARIHLFGGGGRDRRHVHKNPHRGAPPVARSRKHGGSQTMNCGPHDCLAGNARLRLFSVEVRPCFFSPPGRIQLHLSTTVQINRTASRSVDCMGLDHAGLHPLWFSFVSGLPHRSVHRRSTQDVFSNPELDLMVHNCEQHTRFVTRIFGPARSLSCFGEYSYFSVSSAF